MCPQLRIEHPMIGEHRNAWLQVSFHRHAWSWENLAREEANCCELHPEPNHTRIQLSQNKTPLPHRAKCHLNSYGTLLCCLAREAPTRIVEILKTLSNT